MNNVPKIITESVIANEGDSNKESSSKYKEEIEIL